MTITLKVTILLLFILSFFIPISNASNVSDPNNRFNSFSNSEFANNYSNETDFRVNPSIELNQTQKVIRYHQEGIAALNIQNPKVNRVNAIVEVTIITSREIIVKSDMFSFKRSLSDNRSESFYEGYYTVKPGDSVFNSIQIVAEETGDYNVSFYVIYYPEGHQEKFQSSNVTYKFLVEEGFYDHTENETSSGTLLNPGPSHSDIPNIFDETR